MALLEAKRKADLDHKVELTADDRGHLYVNAGDLDSVSGGEPYFDNTAVLPDEPSKGQLCFGVNDQDIVQPFRFNDDQELLVTSDVGNIDVSIPPLPPSGTMNRSILYSTYFTQSGASDTKEEINLNGSVTPKVHYIAADPGGDIYITRIQILLLDGSINLSKFGALPELAVGFSINFILNGITVSLVDKAKTSGEIQVQANPTDPFGTQGTVNIIPNFKSAIDAQVVNIDITAFHPWGIRIGRGNADRVEVVNSDNLTGLDGLTVRAIGYKVLS